MRVKRRRVATSNHLEGSFRALADGRCFETASCSNETAIADHPIYTDSAYKCGESRERFRSKLKCEESRTKSGRFRSENEENNDDEESKNFRKRLADGSFELSKVIDDQLTVNNAGRFRRAESFLKRVLRENVGEKCDRLLRTIKEGQSLLKKNTQRNPSLRKDVQEDSLPSRKNILEKVLSDNTNDQQNLILEKEKGIRKNLKEDIKELPLFLKKNIQRKANRNHQSPVKDIRDNPRLLKENIEDSPLLVQKKTQKGELLIKEELLAITHDQENATSVRRDNHNSCSSKKEGTNKDVNKSFLLPKKKEEYRLTNLEKWMQKSIEKDLSSSKKTKANEISQLTTKNIEETKLFLKKYVQERDSSLTESNAEKSSHLINRNVDDNLLLTKKNISIDPLMQLTRKDIKKNLELSKSVFEENVCLEKDFEETLQLTVKSSLLSQRKDIPVIHNNDSQLRLRDRIIQDDSLITKNLISLAEEEKDIPVVPQLIDRNVRKNFSLTKDPYSPARKVIFSAKQDISLSEKEKDILEENVLSQLTKNVVQTNLSLTNKLCFLSEENISSTEKEEKQPTSVQSTPSAKKNPLTVDDQAAAISSLKLKQIKSDSINFSYQSSIIHRRYLSKDTHQQANQRSEKKVRKGSNSVYKVKRSPPPEENWLGQESAGSDNSGSADKYDSIVTCKLMVSNRYAERQSIAKPPEEHIKIFKISSCSEQLIDNSEKVSLADSIVGSIESVSKCPNFDRDSKKDPVTGVKEFDESLKCRIIKVQESEETLKEPSIKIKDSGETATNQVTEVDINNLLALKIIDNFEAPYRQELIQRDSQNSFDPISHEFHDPIAPQLPLIVHSKKDPEKRNLSKNPFDKTEDSSIEIKIPKKNVKNPFIKKYTNNSSISKIIGNSEALNNQRLIQKSSILIDHQLDNSQVSLIERKLLDSEKRHRLIDKRPHKNPKMRLNIRLIRIRDKLVLCLSALAIVFTLLLVMDLQMDLGYSGHHLNPSHARVRIGDPPDADTVYNNFRRRFLQRGNGSREQANSDITPSIEKSKKNEVTPLSSTMRKHDDFTDLMDLVVNGYAVNVDEGVARISGEDREYNPTIGELRKMILK